jgi:hypothetical protein
VIHALRLLLVAVGLALANACLTVTAPATSFSSDPPGARLLVDGQDSGWVTPCLVALDVERTYEISLELEGFVPYRIALRPSYRRQVVDWQLGASGAQSTIHFPLFLPQPDLFRPFRLDHSLQPGRVFARLRPREEP